jgi:hypothetical protein
MSNIKQIVKVAEGMRILQCEKHCKHPYQDKKYGTGNRAHNSMKNGSFRCTVCGTERKA